ncbi:hypothetical protein [Saccharothrix carnea]|uniref:hypothetical protein n=1 Tax=Saccharothrix carnea TaxID=1280637 RepID=UPI001FE3FB73|nr:hypothetical protein [Saccharothrix carnea]
MAGDGRGDVRAEADQVGGVRVGGEVALGDLPTGQVRVRRNVIGVLTRIPLGSFDVEKSGDPIPVEVE